MSDQRNAIKAKAKQLKTLLNEKGIEIKHTQSVEIMSKILHNKPWHSFQKDLKKEIISYDNEFLKNTLSQLHEQKFKNKFVFGEYHNKAYCLDTLENSNILIGGAAGSGKTNLLKFILMCHMANNSINSEYFFIDYLDGMSEFNTIFKKNLSNVHRAIDNKDLDNIGPILACINSLHSKLIERRRLFHKEGVSNYIEYEKKSNKTINRLVVAIENFYRIPQHHEIKYNMNSDRHDTTAFRLRELFLMGRKYGIQFIITSPRITASDIPNELRCSMSQTFLSRVNHPAEGNVATNLEHVSKIKNEDKGKFAFENGFIEVPLISNDLMKITIEEMYIHSKKQIDPQNIFNLDKNVSFPNSKKLIELYEYFKKESNPELEKEFFFKSAISFYNKISYLGHGNQFNQVEYERNFRNIFYPLIRYNYKYKEVLKLDKKDCVPNPLKMQLIIDYFEEILSSSKKELSSKCG